MREERDRFPNPAVVIGSGITALGLVRSLGRHGIEVYAISDKRDPVIFSKYCKNSFTMTGKRYDKRILKRSLIKICKSFSRRAVIYPTSDLDALNLAELKNELSDNYFFVVGDKETVETFVNKKKFYRVLSDRGIVHPRTHFPENVEEVQRLGSRLDYPVFLKPAITQLFSQVFPDCGKGFVAYSSRELLNYYCLVTRYRIDVMIQEIVPGPPTNSYQLEGYYNSKHDPLVLFARQRLRIWPPNFGNTTLCISVPINELNEEKISINKLIADIGYNGFASAEFKKDERDGELKLLEINVRPWWHFWLSEICGVDIVLASYLDAIGEAREIAFGTRYKLGVKSIYLFSDFMAVANMIWNKMLTFRELMSSLRGVQCDAFFSRDDLTPFMIAFTKAGCELFKYMYKNKVRKPVDYFKNLSLRFTRTRRNSLNP